MAPGKVDSLAVVLLLSEDPSRAAGFYRDVLGLDLAEEEHGGRHRHYAVRTGSVYFTIQHAGDFTDTPRGTGWDDVQLCFTVQDLDAFLHHLREQNVELLHPPKPFEHTIFITLRDPDGRLVRIMTPWQ